MSAHEEARPATTRPNMRKPTAASGRRTNLQSRAEPSPTLPLPGREARPNAQPGAGAEIDGVRDETGRDGRSGPEADDGRKVGDVGRAGRRLPCYVTDTEQCIAPASSGSKASSTQRRQSSSSIAPARNPAYTQARSTCLQYRQAKTMIGLKLPAQLRHNCNTTATTSKLTVASQMRRSCADRLIASSHAVRAEHSRVAQSSIIRITKLGV